MALDSCRHCEISHPYQMPFRRISAVKTQQPIRLLPAVLHRGTEAARHDIPVRSAVIAGWPGRDPVAVEQHIAELAELGVRRPASTPIFYRVAATRLTTDGRVEVSGENVERGACREGRWR